MSSYRFLAILSCSAVTATASKSLDLPAPSLPIPPWPLLVLMSSWEARPFPRRRLQRCSITTATSAKSAWQPCLEEEETPLLFLRTTTTRVWRAARVARLTPSTFPCSRVCAAPSSHFWRRLILHHSWLGPLSSAPFPWAVLRPSRDDWLIITTLRPGVSCRTALPWLCLSYWWHSCGWLLPFAHCVSWPLSLLSVCLSILTDVCKGLFVYCWMQMAQPSYPSRMRLRTFLDAGFDSLQVLETPRMRMGGVFGCGTFLWTDLFVTYIYFMVLHDPPTPTCSNLTHCIMSVKWNSLVIFLNHCNLALLGGFHSMTDANVVSLLDKSIKLDNVFQRVCYDTKREKEKPGTRRTFHLRSTTRWSSFG